jgi:hypothetical protein
MVIIWDRSTIFIHIPRTGGMALSQAIEQYFVRSTVDFWESRIHATYLELQPQFPSFSFFTIMRSPWDIFMSHYRWCALMHWHNFTRTAHEIEDYCHSVVNAGFTKGLEVIAKHGTLCKRPGFWATYAGDGVDVYQYDDQPFTAISSRLDCPMEVPVVNQSEGQKPLWTSAAVELVADICADDIERFGYVPPVV